MLLCPSGAGKSRTRNNLLGDKTAVSVTDFGLLPLNANPIQAKDLGNDYP